MSNIEHPLVTIAIPTYNSGPYFDALIKSIENQTYPNTEVIISDNASTDGTREIAEKVCQRNGWLLLKNKENIGDVKNINQLIEKSSGEYVALYHSDDLYDETIVEKTIDFFLRNESVGLVGTMGVSIDERDSIISEFALGEDVLAKGCVIDYDDAVEETLKRKNAIFITPSITVKKGVFKEVGLFDSTKKFKSANDYEMWLRISKKYKIGFVNEKLIKYRNHVGQGSQKVERENYGLPDIVLLAENVIGETQNRKNRKRYEYYRDRIIFLASLKSNRNKYFKQSNAHLTLVKSVKLVPAKLMLITLNTLKLTFDNVKEFPFSSALKKFVNE